MSAIGLFMVLWWLTGNIDEWDMADRHWFLLAALAITIFGGAAR